MAVVIDGTTGITTPAETAVNITYTGTLTGNGGIVNLGSGQVYKDASGNVGIGTSSPTGIASYPTVDIKGASGGAIRLGSASVGSYVYTDAAGMTVGTAGASPLNLFTNGVERARIDSSGNLLVGTTTNTFVSRLVLNGGASNNTLECVHTGTASTYNAIFSNGNGGVGSIQTSGSTTSYVTSSDYRLKEAIAPMTGALAKVALLKPCTYKWKVDGSDGQGFIAHELAEVEAGCVTGEKDAVDSEGNPQYQGIDTSFLIATLSAAIQELKAIVDAQAERITALEGAAA